MNRLQTIPVLLQSLPQQRVVGRTKLQKLIYLLKAAGAPIQYDYKLHHYGPYSAEVAGDVDLLDFIGSIEESIEPIDIYNQFLSTFTLREPVDASFSPSTSELAETLNAFRSTELEVAATIQYFKELGHTNSEAVALTENMKPTKTTPDVVSRANKILRIVEQYTT